MTFSICKEIQGKHEEDSGSYECRAENEVGTDSRFYQVTILGKASLKCYASP